MGAPGDVIDGRFELVDRLGSGGMGTVWRALDLVLHREVAVKEVRSAAGRDDPEFRRVLRERVLREARAQARINHPNVVTIHHIVDEGEHPWLVMELLPGQSLARRLEQGPLPPTEAARTGREVLAGLRAAHAVGIRHRDVKPANVLMRADGSAVLTDFGIAALQDAASLTMTGEVIGTPEYLAPERIRGADLPASDLWSLGMMLYVCVEGVSPMRRSTTLATLAAVLDEPVPVPHRAGPLAAVLAALLVRDPAERPSAERLDRLLAAVARDTGSAVPPDPTRLDRAPASPPDLSPVSDRPPSADRFGTPPPPPPLPPGPAPRPDLPAPTPLPTPVPFPPHAATPRDALPTIGPLNGSGPHGIGPDRRRKATALAAAAAVTALALLGIGRYALFKPGTDGHSDGRGTASPTVSVVSTGPGSPSATPPPGPTGTSQTDPAPTPGTTAGTTGAPGATDTPAGTQPSTPAAIVPGGDDPAPGVGRWIAQLYSEPEGTGIAARDRRLAAIHAEVPEAQVLRSGDYASLNPGYWVVYAPGPFADGRAAITFCAQKGRTTANECIGRYLSADQGDYGYQCTPPADSPGGRCRHT
ncbi:serine/threonine protein kinase [Streptomyces sp. NBC_01278]|uniref:serine/threonine-protein kinase n=1 Tax=unclassified Streptomyces TaxID=2593676 RepID=UPI002E14A6BE|nr:MULTISPECIES: serine/threonine-protein kinase [unclassified Streptomyces]WSR23789.1 serine/threonine protein kinase [Streptomyces sp. NBC_01205]